ncbi:MAG: 3-oxoacyl-ACP reductase FabG [Ruminococcaceae bacterium]|nr:3-oxoacyl-ACP reductase FabG [Oscillospiraceae bacterium]
MVVLITGASSGIGAACALEFAKHGYSVAVNYNKNDAGALEVVNAINDAGGVAKSFHADIRDTNIAAELVYNVRVELGEIDVLVNNAGVYVGGLVQEITDEEYDYVMDTNVRGTFSVTRAVLPSMIAKKQGAIINISSMWGEVGASYETLYSMSKAAIIGFTKALAKEVGPSNIRVNCVSPGVIDTSMNVDFSAKDIDALCDETPLHRIGTPTEIAKAVYFLASHRSSFITGQNLGVNGGFTI